MNQPGTHKMTEAVEGQIPPADANAQGGKGHAGAPHPDAAEVAEQTRLAQGRSVNNVDGIEDRDQRLIKDGRGQQTHG